MFIFLVFILFVAVSTFFLIQKKYTKATLFMLLMGFSYLIVVSCIIIYMSKDGYYYYSLKDFFGINQSLQNQLMFLPVSRITLIRLMNLFTMVFLYAGLCSAIFFAFQVQFKRRLFLLAALAVPCIIQVILYDPSFYTYLYFNLYPDYVSSQSFISAYEALHSITFVLNTLYIVAGSVLLIYALYDAPKVRQIRSNIFMILISYISVQVTYYYINYWAPDILINVSKAARFIRFKPISLVGNPSIYILLPYIVGFCLLVSLYSIYKYTRIQNSIKNQESVISKNIDSALLTSRVFSHYMKNELLAIMAQTEFLESMCEKSPEVVEEIRVIEQRCRKVYDRLDAVHQKTLKSKIELEPIVLNELLDKLLREMQLELKHTQTKYTPPNRQLVIMADPYYFSQAIENLISNAVDALEFVPEKSRLLTIEIIVKNKWVELVITDNGAGIAEEDVKHIFQPFYSSKPTATNWGMGLSICLTIISTHGGKINAESKLGEGSSFHIIMPLLSTANN
ncbi:signal transduction histidine kinase [Paenibacillus anaericanus]|uniref:sensor histidine kinase n=1 Tax=Paenibacillus anaericanus TaxID=170367 RepID=UPI00278256A8|nr:HAMP domain-containing sensor histidine kinase [Paenibacillus anaericanus]MDQ0092137.1 signal transduction histidine kinase [Paenibacillus anaericanus]